jgi:hypothetical protein
MVASSINRVADQTDPAINDRIDKQTGASVGYFASHRDEIDDRLRQLDEEWDIERMLETGSSSLSLAGLILSVLRGRKWLLLTLTVQGFFLQHAVQGWCPPLAMLRRWGFRTQSEIEQERYALKLLRGDFKDLAAGDDAKKAGADDRLLKAVRK